MVEAARKYKRMVQIGTQNRSSPNVMRRHAEAQGGRDRQALHGPRHDLQDARQPRQAHAPARARGAGLGRLGRARPRWSSTAASATAAGTGSRTSPAATIANQTVHDIDKIRWGLGLDTHPITVMSMGGRYVRRRRRRRHAQHAGVPVQWGEPQGAGHLRDPPLVHQRARPSMRDKYPFVRRTSASARSSSAAKAT